jgi:hypothetical protein
VVNKIQKYSRLEAREIAESSSEYDNYKVKAGIKEAPIEILYLKTETPRKPEMEANLQEELLIEQFLNDVCRRSKSRLYAPEMFPGF